MPIIYMKHPRHGAKIATMELEAEFDEQNGWVRYTPNQESDEVVDSAPVNELTRRGRRRKETVNGDFSR